MFAALPARIGLLSTEGAPGCRSYFARTNIVAIEYRCAG